MRSIFIFFVLFYSFSEAQTVSAELKSSIALDAHRFVGVDEYKNIYTVKDNILSKAGNNQTYQYNDILLGELSSVDLLNPLKVVLFYEDTNTAVILDNTLSEINRINFNQIEDFRNVQFATTANDRNLWIYNLDLQQLEVYDYNRSRIVSNSLPISERVLRQKSNFNFCWLLTETNIQRYNIYGSLMNTYHISGINAFTEKNGNLVISTADGLEFLKKGEEEFKPISLPKFDVKQLYLDIENLYIYDGEILHHYQLQLAKN